MAPPATPTLTELLAPEVLLPPVRKGQIVKSEDAGNNEIDPNTNFLGAKNQKAKSAEIARVGDGKTPQSPKPENAQKEQLSADGSLPSLKKDWKQLSLKDLGMGGALVSDAVKNASKGERTILSTREFKYFAYYERIRQLAVEQHWRPLLDRAIQRVWAKNQAPSADEVTTQVRLLLDRKGEVQKISVLKPSGVREFDEAATLALERGAPFPNPPSGMMDEDGFVRIDWSFQVELLSTSVKLDFGPPTDDTPSRLR